jgi:hypothetical protein
MFHASACLYWSRTLSAAVGMYRPYQYELRRRMRDIAEDVEKIKLHRGYATATQHTRPASLWDR